MRIMAMTWMRSNLVGLKLFQNLDQQTELRLAMIFYVLYNHFAIARGSMLSAACLGLRLQAGKAVSSEAECRKNYQAIVHSDSDLGPQDQEHKVDHILRSSFNWHLSKRQHFILSHTFLGRKSSMKQGRVLRREGKLDCSNIRGGERETLREPHSH